MRRRTYEPAVDAGLTSAYPHLGQYVYSRTLGDVDDPTLTVIGDDPVGHVRELKHQRGMDIWLCGGSILAGQLINEIDELILKVNPVVIGTGRPLFERQFKPQSLRFASTQAYDSGVMVNRFRRH